MANLRNANTFYIDTAFGSGGTTLAGKNIQVLGVMLYPTAAGSVCRLDEVTTGAAKIFISSPNQYDARYFDFSNSPIVFPGGILPAVATNCAVVCIIRDGGA